jgi:hypothetical protein
MARAVLAALVLLPLALAGCSDSSDSSSSATPPYATTTPPPAAPVGPPLTDADVQKWVAVTLDFFKARVKTPEGQKALLEKHGYTPETWFPLDQRIRKANGSITGNEKHGMKIPPEREADVAVIRPHREKILKALEGKAVE